MIKDYTKAIIREDYDKYYDYKDAPSLREYVETEAENAPGFFAFLFQDSNIEGYSDLTDAQKAEYKEYLNSL